MTFDFCYQKSMGDMAMPPFIEEVDSQKSQSLGFSDGNNQKQKSDKEITSWGFITVFHPAELEIRMYRQSCNWMKNKTFMECRKNYHLSSGSPFE